MMHEFLTTLRSWRKNRGLTQAQIGETLHLSQSAVSRIESGSRAVKLEHLLQLAEALGIQIEWNSGNRHYFRIYECTHCHQTYHADMEPFSWCPHCGYEGTLELTVSVFWRRNDKLQEEGEGC